MAKVYDLLESSNKTKGEKRVKKLIEGLPAQYMAFAEPRLKLDDKSNKPDFIILAQDLGVVVVEIKDWVQLIEADSNNIKVRRRDHSELILPNPVNTAEQYAYDLKDIFEQHQELLHQHRGVIRLSFPWQIMVVLTNIDENVIEQFEQAGIWQKHVVIGKRALASKVQFENAILRLPWLFKLKSPLDEPTMDIINTILNPRIQVDNDAETNTIAERRIQTELIEEPLEVQRQLFKDEEIPADSFSVRLVRGVAGSGKTLVLTRRARYLRQTYPDLNLCVVTFNKHLAQNLSERINLPDVEVTNFHKLCAQIMHEKWKGPHQIEKWLYKNMRDAIKNEGFSVDFVAEEIAWRKDLNLFDNQHYLEIDRKGRGTGLSVDKRAKINTIFDAYLQFQGEDVLNLQDMQNADWEDVPNFALKELQNPDHPMRGMFDVILIDEAQDFAPAWLDVLKLLLADGGTLFICDDPTQSLFRYFTWKEKGINVTGHSKWLRIPLRGTREISQAAYSVIASDEGLTNNPDMIKPRFEYALPSGTMPRLFECYDDEAEAQCADQTIQEWLDQGVSTTEIAILCHSGRLLDDWKHWEEAGCYVATFRQMKGLEFRAVLLPHLHTLFRMDNADSSESASELTRIRQRLYTAMTRSKQFLTLTYQRELSEYLSGLLPYVWHDEV